LGSEGIRVGVKRERRGEVGAGSQWDGGGESASCYGRAGGAGR
jgi:hypothetical protein